MGRQASAAAAQAGRTGELQEPAGPPGAQPMPVRTRSAPAPARARQLFTPPGPGPHLPSSRYANSEGSHYASAQLSPAPAAAASARRLTRDCLDRWDMRALTDDAELIASELIANALAAVHPAPGGLTIVYALHATPHGLRIYTWDIGPGHPRTAPLDADAETGRGLTIIDALTNSNWGWWPTPAGGGKVTWAQLPAPAPTASYIP